MSDSARPSRFRGRLSLAFGAGVVAMLVLRVWREFFWPHAIIVGLAVTAFVYSLWRTWETLRR
ncbi:MAG: hypothetical protein OEM62_08860 [Acidobacteriota bacterium]|nr:hypothetical protein [Acidobacteriota bacterium]